MGKPVIKASLAIFYLEQFLNEMELQLKEEETNKRTKKHCNKFYSRQVFYKYKYSLEQLLEAYKETINCIKAQRENEIDLETLILGNYCSYCGQKIRLEN